jgi:hypothetical protein
MTKPSVTNQQREFYDNYYDEASEWRWGDFEAIV